MISLSRRRQLSNNMHSSRALGRPLVLGLVMTVIQLLLVTATAQPQQEPHDANCYIPLNPSHAVAADPNEVPTCLTECLHSYARHQETFLCDVTANWLHHIGKLRQISRQGEILNQDYIQDNWYPATPAYGSGVHEYARHFGKMPPCDKNGYCEGCSAAALETFGARKICSVFIDPTDCSITCSPPLEDNATDNLRGAQKRSSPIDNEYNNYVATAKDEEDEEEEAVTSSIKQIMTSPWVVGGGLFLGLAVWTVSHKIKMVEKSMHTF